MSTQMVRPPSSEVQNDDDSITMAQRVCYVSAQPAYQEFKL
ncbi:hypothetical protein Psal071_03318 (plasmid) [Piscirickettsia salmonis]|uniref:Uncharacterized protein n=1 Tax=Piscirickettsia salmonis TaxID=1238 RepID=A0A9Q6PRG7_PISSA|nr:hypothetical protein Psal009_00484 [Piscirickettsia salmonis]QGO36005.1 hypothetical protein Psal028_03388 [Piscirickettsia salmonis]QGO39630.1 hypothetical protein Psal040_03403 [Piscirickettsia salmonis]QGO43192.1 hypothetical protein Psal041_03339 [Piscirickettsia salmonis]QGO46728.1 hypothetical protein Psal051_03313 [Piscirickettsia salmonis]